MRLSLTEALEQREHRFNRGIAKGTASDSELPNEALYERGSRELREHRFNRGIAKGTASDIEPLNEARES